MIQEWDAFDPFRTSSDTGPLPRVAIDMKQIMAVQQSPQGGLLWVHIAGKIVTIVADYADFVRDWRQAARP